MSDTLTFLREWVSDPMRVAALAPSGQAVADLMTGDLGPGTGPVIELGPGTGAFTRALLARGIPEEDLTLVEYGSDFARLLAMRHPKAQVLWMDAARVGAYPDLLRGRRAGAVVSGLPILSMNPRKQLTILAGCFSHLRPGGAFLQFTYGPACPVPRVLLERLGLRARRVGRTLCNLPPASVYRITRRAGHAGSLGRP